MGRERVRVFISLYSYGVDLKSLLKWQLPNFTQLKDYKISDGYNIIPLVGFIKLIDSLNKINGKFHFFI